MERFLSITAEQSRALLAGATKLVVRVKKQPRRTVSDWSKDFEHGDVVLYRGLPHVLEISRGRNKRDSGELTPKQIVPPFSPGDVVVCRETWQCGKAAFPSGIGLHVRIGSPEKGDKLVYRADGNDYIPPMPWRPSIHMPRWAARHVYLVSDVRCQQVQGLTEKDFIDMGCPTEYLVGGSWFKPLWEASHPGSWERNDWVWILTLMRVKG